MPDEQVDQTKPKRRYDELFDKFNDAAKGWLNEIPEARSLILVADWESGQQDFPPCTFVTRKLNEHTLLQMLKQSVKLQEYLTMIFSKMLEKADSLVNKAEALLKTMPEDQLKANSA